MNDKKPVDLKEYKEKRSDKIRNDYLKEVLEKRGLEINEENLKLAEAEYGPEFSDELKQTINEHNLSYLIKDENGLISSGYKKKKIMLLFASGDKLEIMVDLNGELQTEWECKYFCVNGIS